jgi:hypothetical protein
MLGGHRRTRAHLRTALIEGPISAAAADQTLRAAFGGRWVWPPSGGVERPRRVVRFARLIHAARPRSWRTFGPRRLRRHSDADRIATLRDTGERRGAAMPVASSCSQVMRPDLRARRALGRDRGNRPSPPPTPASARPPTLVRPGDGQGAGKHRGGHEQPHLPFGCGLTDPSSTT